MFVKSHCVMLYVDVAVGVVHLTNNTMDNGTDSLAAQTFHVMLTAHG